MRQAAGILGMAKRARRRGDCRALGKEPGLAPDGACGVQWDGVERTERTSALATRNVGLAAVVAGHGDGVTGR